MTPAAQHPAAPHPAAPQWVFAFGPDGADGFVADEPADARRERLGNKGAGLAEMSQIGLPVPPGFTITAQAVRALVNGDMPAGLADEIERGLAHIERVTGRGFGRAGRPDGDGMPLLLSVRSGATASMPGMMDTLLDLGVNPATLRALSGASGSPAFAEDVERRFLTMYANLVCNHSTDHIDEDAPPADLRATLEERGVAIPDDVRDQLWGAIRAVAASWNNERAQAYRRIHRIPASLGTAITVQAMVFGNLGQSSATGVAFTRDPSTGENRMFGEYLPEAQGEDVVGGAHTPYDLTEVARHRGGGTRSLERSMPTAFAALKEAAARLEAYYRDAQDIEFTIENGTLWLLQTRAAKRSSRAMMRMAVEMAREGLIDEADAVLRIDPTSIDHVLQPVPDPAAKAVAVMRGLPASPGAATGEIALDEAAVTAARAEGRPTILIRAETSPEDVSAMAAATGILTAHGGMTSHAAVVARGMSKPCITAAGAMRIDLDRREVVVPGNVLKEGETITIDGASGQVMRGAVEMIQPSLPPEFMRVMTWADRHRRLKVMANVDTAADARTARACGAEGIGLCRTEPLFFRPGRIEPMRTLIVSTDNQAKAQAARDLVAAQRDDLRGIFEVMDGLPVTLRLLDMPLHRFLNRQDDAQDDAARRKRVALEEQSPALGQRGPRMLLAHPRLVAIQVHAALLAARDAAASTGETPPVRFLVPFIMTAAEMIAMRRRIAQAVKSFEGEAPAYQVGAMIETPRACLIAGDLAETSDFLSFGTNDLTQLVMGLGQEESAPFLTRYRNAGLLATDPFQAVDMAGLGEMMAIACDRARERRADIDIAVCGEQAAHAGSAEFFESVGVDCISCTPFRVPMARLASTQAHLKSGRGPGASGTQRTA